MTQRSLTRSIPPTLMPNKGSTNYVKAEDSTQWWQLLREKVKPH